MKIKIIKRQLERQVEEAVIKYLMENRSLITEMAVERKLFVNKSIDVITHLRRHVLLITYCILYDRENQNFKHWKREIYAFCELTTIVSLKDVSKAKQITVKKKVLTKTWIEDFEITNNRTLNGIWTVLSGEENITSGLTEDMVKLYTNIIHNLINYISNSNEIELKNYINSL